MKKLYTVFCLFLFPFTHYAQDTFSIVAVDSVTGEVGSAGATCLDNSVVSGGARVISDVFNGRGAIHSQALLNAGNKANARNRFLAGDSPDEIIAWLIANDVQDTPTVRQYGIVDFGPNGSPRSAAYTGVDCMDYKNHIVGPNYAIQGNILLGPEILDSMESRFLNTNGTLAEKLMAAMQGANVPGADTRCLSEGVSSLSAFLRVAKPNDPEFFNSIDLLVGSTPFGVEPIDSLQTLLDNWMPPNCIVTIPADVTVIDSSVSTSQGNTSFWVCAGDTLRLTGTGNTIYLESGAFFEGVSGNNNDIFVKDSAGMNGGNILLTDVYFEVGSDLVNPGLAPFYFNCDSIVYDYSIAPQNGCLDNSTRIERNSLESLGWTMYPNPAQGKLYINVRDQIKEAAQITFYDIAGRIAFETEIKANSLHSVIELPEDLKGLFLLEVKTKTGKAFGKWMLE